MRTTRTTACALAALALAVTMAASGCGGGKKAATTTGTSATVQWADGVCSAVGDWQTQMKSIGSSLEAGNLSQSSLNDAVSKAQKATKTLERTLKGLGEPSTQSGAQAKSSVDQLATELSTSAQKIDDAIAGASGAAGMVTAISTVSAELATMGTDVKSTVDTLKSLDVQGELTKAFKDAGSCAALGA